MSSSSSERRARAAKIRRERHQRRISRQFKRMYYEFSFFQMFLLILRISFASLQQKVSGREDIHRERKDLEKDIFAPLGNYYFRRAYRMKKDSFYHLHDLLVVGCMLSENAKMKW